MGGKYIPFPQPYVSQEEQRKERDYRGGLSRIAIGLILLAVLLALLTFGIWAWWA